ncbi:MAG: type II secretion system F family protein [Actinobacteria bacterium]|nr:type II secretion system F family protein [Actinomycetota bacterium]
MPRRDRAGTGWTTRRDELIRQAGIESVSSGQLLGLQLGAAVLAGLLIQLVTATLAVSACFTVFAFAGPPALVRRLRQRRQVALRELWPEAIDNLASAVRAGMSLPEAVSGLGLRGPEPLRPAFGRFAVAYRASGRFAECLVSLKRDLADPVGDRVCETLRVAREVGGSDLGTVLRTLSELLRVDARTRAELETRQGWTISAARLAVAAPWIVLLLLGSQSANLRGFDSSAGVLLLGIGAAVCLVAYRIMVRIGRLPEEPRVLR